MRKLLFALLILPAICQAQIEFGINGGTAPLISSTDKSTGEWTNPESSKWPKSGPIENVTISIGCLKVLKAGLGYQISSQLYQMRSPFIFIEYAKKINKSELYAGINAGMIFFTNNTYVQCSTSGTGFDYGAHAGYSYNIFNDFYLNAQIGYDFISASAKGTQGYEGSTKTNVSIFIPVTIGIHYKLLTHKNKGNGRSE